MTEHPSSLPPPIPDDHENGPDTQRQHGTHDHKTTGLITVLLVDDHTLVREGLRHLLSLEDDLQVVGEAVDGLDALQKIRKLHPNVVLMDIMMPIVDGITLTRQVVQEFPDIAVIMLTMYRQNQQMLQAMKNGARGYIPKTASAHEVAETIRTVYTEGLAIKPEMTRAIVGEFRRLADTVSSNQAIDLLTEKELEIIRYVAAGFSNREIAERLSYSEKTVKNYLSIIFQKLHLRDRTQVAIFALRHGLLSDEEMTPRPLKKE
ncbi:response regulator transcription factor [Ktedonospora formicarum]|uniref:DNA-binding response regulator n=1 Tax=Ktedonospora formicarum TaxID=2778364 RepID=A0A8J3I1X9_9CHLR|nr:response regulator transcription factor [Ktedonospora formicarum]GHO43999.1 DNA-binding response regulator [Ktedonospora formicarum]